MAFVFGSIFIQRSSPPSSFKSLCRKESKPCYSSHRSITKALLPDVNQTEESKTDTVVQFFKSLGISNEASVRSAQRYPSLKKAGNLEARARPILEALHDLSLTPQQISRALGHLPTLILHNPTEFIPRLTFLQDTVNIPFERLPRVIARCPHVLIMDIQSARKVYDTICDTCEEYLQSHQLGEVFSRIPQVLVRPLRLLKRNLKWLSTTAGLETPSQFGRVFSQVPLVVVYEIETNLAARINVFSSLGLSPSAIGRVVVATPQLLTWNIERELQPRANALIEIVGKEGVSSVLEKVPVLLTTESKEHVEWLREVVGLNSDEIKQLVLEAPAVLAYSISGNLAAKWAFLKTMGGTKQDLIQCPREMFCAALNQRAVPRFAFSSSKGLRLPIPTLLRGLDADFCAKHNFSYPEYRKYVNDDTYLLFYSQLV